MIEIRIVVKNPRADILGIKEALAYYCEAYGDIKLISVSEIKEPDGQMSLWKEAAGWREKTVNIDGPACRECPRCHKVRAVDNFCSACGAELGGQNDGFY